MIVESFLQDFSFLRRVNEYRVTEYYAEIMILDFETERRIGYLQGRVTQGSINITTAAVRRSGSLTLVFDNGTFDLTNPDNLIAINKKISMSIGIDNPFFGRERWGRIDGGDETAIWEQYPNRLMFPQGMFIITKANTSVGTNRTTVTMNFVDKMAMLNGVCGGTIPAGISLHDRITIDGDGNVTVDYPRIRQIIFEIVQEFGGEHPANIIINDVPEFGRRVTRYEGNMPIWFAETAPGHTGPGGFVRSPTQPPGFPIRRMQGDDVGYMASELIFPGELVKSAGATVEAVLKSLADALGNYEYFYDIDGRFIFQRIRHFEMTGEAPLVTADSQQTPFNIHPDLDELFQEGYIPTFSDDQFLNEFMNSDLVSSVNFNPQFQQIKNDFVVWGTRQRNGEDSVVRMRLAIDNKPRDTWATTRISLCYQWIWEIRREDNTILRYLFLPTGQNPVGWTFDGDDLEGRGTLTTGTERNIGQTIRLHSPALRRATGTGIEPTRNLHAGIRNGGGNYEMAFEWREELYRMALNSFHTGSRATDYDMELMAEWREIYDPNSDLFALRWFEQFGTTSPFNGYRVEIVTDPSSIRYWLDIIDTNSSLGQYSVNRIGRRTIVEDNNQIHDVLNRQVPSIVFIDGRKPEEERIAALQEQLRIGQTAMLLQADLVPLFSFRNSFGSCYEEIRNLLHRHLIYNASVTIQSQPIFYLDVNRVVRLNFPNAGIVGNFIINRLSWNLGGNPRMSLTANEAVTIV